MPNGRILQHDPPVVRSDQTRRDVAGKGREDVKLGRSPGLNLVREERSSLCIIAYVERREDQEDSLRSASDDGDEPFEERSSGLLYIGDNQVKQGFCIEWGRCYPSMFH